MRAASCRRCRASPNAGARGLSGARNTGVAAARGDVVAFLDDDAVAAPDWLERLLAAYDDAGRARRRRRDRAALGRRAARVVPAPSSTGSSAAPTAGCPSAPAPVRNLIGANMSFRREVFDARRRLPRTARPRRHAPARLRGDRAVHPRAPAAARRRRSLRAARAGPPPRPARAAPRWRYFRARCFAEGLSKARSWRVARAGGRARVGARLRDADAAARACCATGARRASAATRAALARGGDRRRPGGHHGRLRHGSGTREGGPGPVSGRPRRGRWLLPALTGALALAAPGVCAEAVAARGSRCGSRR